MSFSSPNVLFLLFLLIPFVFLGITAYLRKRRILESFISHSAYERLGIRSGKETDLFKFVLTSIIILFLILAMSGPQWGEKFINTEMKSTEVLFLLDTSYSMNARDMNPDRLSVAKEMIKNLVDKIKSDYIGLVTFAASASVQCPMTIDYEVFKLLTDSSVISPPEEQGTDFYEAFKITLNSFRLSEKSEKAVFFITDGEDLEHRWESLIDELKKQHIVIFTIGVGSYGGAPIPIVDKDGKIKGWKKDLKGQIVKTRLNEDVLKKISESTGGAYFRVADASGIQQILNRLEHFERSILRKKVRSIKINRFQYPLFFGIILFIIELFLTSKKVKWKKN